VHAALQVTESFRSAGRLPSKAAASKVEGFNPARQQTWLVGQSEAFKHWYETAPVQALGAVQVPVASPATAKQQVRPWLHFDRGEQLFAAASPPAPSALVAPSPGVVLASLPAWLVGPLSDDEQAAAKPRQTENAKKRRS
jgi:hypothetical protein